VAEPRRSNRSRLPSHRAEFGLRKAVLTRRRPNIETHSIDFDIIPPSQSIKVGFQATYASNDAMAPRGVVGRRTWVLGRYVVLVLSCGQACKQVQLQAICMHLNISLYCTIYACDKPERPFVFWDGNDKRRCQLVRRSTSGEFLLSLSYIQRPRLRPSSVKHLPATHHHGTLPRTFRDRSTQPGRRCQRQKRNE
jgi:hypothetical protein